MTSLSPETVAGPQIHDKQSYVMWMARSHAQAAAQSCIARHNQSPSRSRPISDHERDLLEDVLAKRIEAMNPDDFPRDPQQFRDRFAKLGMDLFDEILARRDQV